MYMFNNSLDPDTHEWDTFPVHNAHCIRVCYCERNMYYVKQIIICQTSLYISFSQFIIFYFQIYPDPFTRKQVSNLIVPCKFADNGCPEKIKVKDLEVSIFFKLVLVLMWMTFNFLHIIFWYWATFKLYKILLIPFNSLFKLWRVHSQIKTTCICIIHN